MLAVMFDMGYPVTRVAERNRRCRLSPLVNPTRSLMRIEDGGVSWRLDTGSVHPEFVIALCLIRTLYPEWPPLITEEDPWEVKRYKKQVRLQEARIMFLSHHRAPCDARARVRRVFSHLASLMGENEQDAKSNPVWDSCHRSYLMFAAELEIIDVLDALLSTAGVVDSPCTQRDTCAALLSVGLRYKCADTITLVMERWGRDDSERALLSAVRGQVTDAPPPLEQDILLREAFYDEFGAYCYLPWEHMGYDHWRSRCQATVRTLMRYSSNMRGGTRMATSADRWCLSEAVKHKLSRELRTLLSTTRFDSTDLTGAVSSMLANTDPPRCTTNGFHSYPWSWGMVIDCLRSAGAVWDRGMWSSFYACWARWADDERLSRRSDTYGLAMYLLRTAECSEDRVRVFARASRAGSSAAALSRVCSLVTRSDLTKLHDEGCFFSMPPSAQAVLNNIGQALEEAARPGGEAYVRSIRRLKAMAGQVEASADVGGRGE